MKTIAESPKVSDIKQAVSRMACFLDIDNESPERAIRVLPGVSPKGAAPGQAIPQISTLKGCKEYSLIISDHNMTIPMIWIKV